VLLQTQAAMRKGKAVASDDIPMEALQALDFDSCTLIQEAFWYRLNSVAGWSGHVADWLQLFAQFIPKACLDLSGSDSWRGVVPGSALQRWYLSCLLRIVEPYLDRLPIHLMGFRKGYQTAMLVEPLRRALQTAKEWGKPIAIACADACSAFESIDHDALVQGWQQLDVPPLAIVALYREMAPTEARVVICGEMTPDGQMVRRRSWLAAGALEMSLPRSTGMSRSLSS